MTTILICGDKRYTVTDEDRLWLTRAVQEEGALRDQVAQTLVNLFAYLYSRKPGSLRTLTALVRAYAQPVNPRWFPEGDLHKKWAARGKDTLKKAMRRRDSHSTQTIFHPLIVRAVSRALTLGPVDIPPHCTDYAAPHIDASGKYKPLTPAIQGRNRLWTRAPKWGGYRVEVVE